MKFRIITDTHYEVPDDRLMEVYGTTDHVEVAQINQEHYRDDGSLLYETMADTTNETIVYVQPFDPGGQMFTDEFVREVIQIMRVGKLHIDISEHGWVEVNPEQGWAGFVHDEKTLHNRNQVKVEFSGIRPATDADPFDYHFHATAIGRSIGEALRNIRERIREDLGR